MPETASTRLVSRESHQFERYATASSPRVEINSEGQLPLTEEAREAANATPEGESKPRRGRPPKNVQ